MGNSSLINGPTNPFINILDSDTTDAVVETNTTSNFNKIMLKSTNNYPFCKQLGNCEDLIKDPVIPDVEVPLPEVPDSVELVETYETVYQNILGYDNVTVMDNPDLYIKEFTLPDNKKIIITNDARTPDVIISTISGDTPDGITLIKTTTAIGDKIVVTYQ